MLGSVKLLCDRFARVFTIICIRTTSRTHRIVRQQRPATTARSTLCGICINIAARVAASVHDHAEFMYARFRQRSLRAAREMEFPFARRAATTRCRRWRPAEQLRQ